MADDIQDISKLKVADLKRELKARGLSVAGNKNELQERLQLSLQGENSLITEPDSAAGDPEEILDEDDVLADEEEEESLVEDITTPTELKRKLSEEEEDTGNKRIASKKVVLNRSVVATSTPSSEKENQQVTDDAGSVHKPDTPASDKKVVKLSAYSIKERLELRAQKFGVELSTDAKKEVRAARFGTSSPITAATDGPASAEVLRKRAERFGLTSSPISATNLNKAELNEKLEKRKQSERRDSSRPGCIPRESAIVSV
ncbi:hypothetical protein L9F63_021817 [Diploptera punctata]|uniref:SAP domain-containing protein n=1 Tax=Diploptera punctata TaxID=6984 RepID=A0AAD8EBE1_DIPPU|nr:hypothetical protein L9F63_021817 [Diploptera punctata]